VCSIRDRARLKRTVSFLLIIASGDATSDFLDLVLADEGEVEVISGKRMQQLCCFDRVRRSGESLNFLIGCFHEGIEITELHPCVIPVEKTGEMGVVGIFQYSFLQPMRDWARWSQATTSP
jgi:hypothetical protein